MAKRDVSGIHWRETGSGRPLLLIMGIGYTSDMWHPVEPMLAANHRLLLFDNRGVGRSNAIPEGYTIAEMAQDALSVLSAAGVGYATASDPRGSGPPPQCTGISIAHNM